jgi:hypothetical protein
MGFSVGEGVRGGGTATIERRLADTGAFFRFAAAGVAAAEAAVGASAGSGGPARSCVSSLRSEEDRRRSNVDWRCDIHQ